MSGTGTRPEPTVPSMIGTLGKRFRRLLNRREARETGSATLPPPTTETHERIELVRQAYERAHVIVRESWAGIDGTARLLSLMLLVVLVSFWVVLVGLRDDSTPQLISVLPMWIAVFAVVIATFGALMQSWVTYVVAIDHATEDLARQLAYAEAATSNLAARAALDEAERILEGRLRYPLTNRKGVLHVAQGPKGGTPRLLRVAGGVLEGGAVLFIGFYAAVGITAIREGLFLGALAACLPALVIGPLVILMGHAMRTFDVSKTKEIHETGFFLRVLG